MNKKPKLTAEELSRIESIYNKLPQGLQKVGMACELGIDKLMAKGYSFEDAENIVIDVFEKSKPYLEKGMYATTITTIENIFE